MSKKDIAFLFYPNDWLGGTQGFSFEHKGAYMELMIYQFNNGPMSIQDIKDVLGPYFDSMWERKLKAKFVFDNGKFFNKRVAESKTKREKYSESRKNNFNGNKQKPETQNVSVTIQTKPTGLIQQYFIDLPNSTLFHDAAKLLKMEPEELKAWIEPFTPKAEMEYQNFARFVTHFKNYVNQERNGKPNPKNKNAGTYNAEGLSQLNNAIKGREEQS